MRTIERQSERKRVREIKRYKEEITIESWRKEILKRRDRSDGE